MHKNRLKFGDQRFKIRKNLFKQEQRNNQKLNTQIVSCPNSLYYQPNNLIYLTSSAQHL